MKSVVSDLVLAQREVEKRHPYVYGVKFYRYILR